MARKYIEGPTVSLTHITNERIDWSLFNTCLELHWSDPRLLAYNTGMTEHQAIAFLTTPAKGQQTLRLFFICCGAMKIHPGQFIKGWKLNGRGQNPIYD